MNVVQKKRSGSESEIFELLVSARRVSKVVQGGRRFSFSVFVVVGDERGMVGCGLGRHSGAAEARMKAVSAAKKNMIRVHLKEGRTFHHDVMVKFCSVKVLLRSARAGTGVIAGGSMRAVLEVLGLKDVVAKTVGASSDPHCLVYAAFCAFKKLCTPRQVAARRGMRVAEIIERR